MQNLDLFRRSKLFFYVNLSEKISCTYNKLPREEKERIVAWNFFIVQRWAGRQPAGRQDSRWGTQGTALPAVRFSRQTTKRQTIYLRR